MTNHSGGNHVVFQYLIILMVGQFHSKGFGRLSAGLGPGGDCS